MVFRNLLSSTKTLGKFTLVEIAASGANRVGRASLALWSIAVALFCSYQALFPLSVEVAEKFYMVFFGMFSVSLVAMGSIVAFFSLNERKPYLARLRLTPLFKNDSEFLYLLLKVFFKQQFIMLIFTLFSVSLVSWMIWPERPEVIANTLVLNLVSFCLFSALTLFGWHTKWQIKKLVAAVMIILFIILLPTALISFEQHFLLTDSSAFLFVLGCSVVLLMLMLAKWRAQALNWQKLV